MRIYDAENAAKRKTRHAARKQAPALDGSIRAAQAYVDRITRSAWFRRVCPPSYYGDETGAARGWFVEAVPRRIIVKATRSKGSGSCPHALFRHRGRWYPRINLGRGSVLARTPVADGRAGETVGYVPLADPWLILHEICHVMTPDDPGHGPAFANAMLQAVGRWLGPAQQKALRAEFRERKVKYRLPRSKGLC